MEREDNCLAEQRAFELEKLKLQSQNPPASTGNSSQMDSRPMRLDLKTVLPTFILDKDDMFTCLTSPIALLDIEVYEATGIVYADTGASHWKNKYLLEISNAPARGNTAESSVPGEANDVDCSPETDSSTKPKGNAAVMPMDRASESKDMRIGSGNEPRNKDVKYDGMTKNERDGYNKQSRDNSNRNNSYRGKQKLDRHPKPNEQRFNRFKNRGGYFHKRFDVEEH
ncbi:hypothetical protein TNIN_314881 [Trichonephila inaurata madagascariensis]|uniref:Uncharacterized protein n=1 Tax=Trichonephila inaurata madagascariensis TaxID=2747483 RepID=A0A8X6Y649_9ARAC|nr:hypothetical protein TNIN_314881 [Trichonephila inaurata madagascariensis]